MTALPAFIGTGIVHFRLGVTVTDSLDPDAKPDFIPATGTVTFRANVDYIPYPSTPEGPLTILKGPIIGKFDYDGYLSTYDGESGEFLYRGVVLTAMDDPNASVKDWTHSASYSIDAIRGTKFNFPTHNFYVTTNSIQDLSTLIPVPSAKGNALAQAELAALRAEAAALIAAANSEASHQAAMDAASASEASRQAAMDAAEFAESIVVANDDVMTEVAKTPGSKFSTQLSAAIVQLTSLDGGNASSTYNSSFNFDGGSAA